jgi:hypothetical protein
MISFCELISSWALCNLTTSCAQLPQGSTGYFPVTAGFESVLLSSVERVVFSSLFRIFIISVKDFTSL